MTFTPNTSLGKKINLCICISPGCRDRLEEIAMIPILIPLVRAGSFSDRWRFECLCYINIVIKSQNIFLLKMLEDQSFFCRATDTSVLVTSALEPSLACFMKWIPQIHLWFDTCWPLGSSAVFDLDLLTCTRRYKHWCDSTPKVKVFNLAN